MEVFTVLFLNILRTFAALFLKHLICNQLKKTLRFRNG